MTIFPIPSDRDATLRTWIIVCMTKKQAETWLLFPYFGVDMSFKRVHDASIKEVVIAAKIRETNKSKYLLNTSLILYSYF